MPTPRPRVLSRPHRARTASVLAALGLAAASSLTAASALAGPAQAAQHASAHGRVTNWTAASKATITPGVMMFTRGAQCTSNFVFTDATGGVYVGYAAHCAGTGSETDTNGCRTTSLPLGTRVTFVDGATPLTDGKQLGAGRLVYSSWLTEKRLKTKDANTCAYNDLALVKVDRADESKVNPTVPFFGGPNGIARGGTKPGDVLYTYGNSSLRGGVSALSPHVGLSIGDSGGGWSHALYSVTPGVPGDSGSGFLDARGRAIGVLSTIGLAPLPASNNIGDLAKELAFAQKHSGIDGLRLAEGTGRFHAPLG